MADEAAKKPAKKEKPTNLVIPPKKPKLSKAERRALQEQQRAAKEATQPAKQNKQKQKPPPKTPPQQPKQGRQQDIPALCHESDDNLKKKEVRLLAHLPPYRGTYVSVSTLLRSDHRTVVVS